jgi:ubiquilin
LPPTSLCTLRLHHSTVKGPSELKLSIAIDPSKTVADLKDAIAAKSDVEKDRQRLIYSGT